MKSLVVTQFLDVSFYRSSEGMGARTECDRCKIGRYMPLLWSSETQSMNYPPPSFSRLYTAFNTLSIYLIMYRSVDT